MTIECSRCGGNHMRSECSTDGWKDFNPDQKHVWHALQYQIEGVILRRLHANRIQGYTLEMANELTSLYFAFRPDKIAPAEGVAVPGAPGQRVGALHDLGQG